MLRWLSTSAKLRGFILTFIPPPEHYNSFDFKFWAREYGSQWLPSEKSRIAEFSRAKPNQDISVKGYVKWIDNQSFALVPTLFSNQIYLLCSIPTEEKPRENSFIEIQGHTQFGNRKQLDNQSTFFQGEQIVRINDWRYTPESLEVPKDNIGYKDFKQRLVYRIEGLEPEIEDFLAFTVVGTPSFYDNVGGINLTLYDSTKKGLSRSISSEMRRIIPYDINDLHSVETYLGRFDLSYGFRYIQSDADIPMTDEIESVLTKRKISATLGKDEVSLSLHSNKKSPVTILDPYCSFADIPTSVPEGATINNKRTPDPDFESFKYMMIQHMKNPTVEGLDDILSNVSGEMERIRQSFGLPAVTLSQHGFLNANYNARPMSIVREALSLARLKNIDLVKQDFVSNVIDTTFRWNFEYVYETWEDLIKQGRQFSKPEFREILRIIDRYQKTGLPGVTKAQIIAEATNEPIQTEWLLRDMINCGQIYEPKRGYFKLV